MLLPGRGQALLRERERGLAQALLRERERGLELLWGQGLEPLLQELLHRRIQEPLWRVSKMSHASIGRCHFSKYHRRRCASCGFPGRQPKMPTQKRQLQLRSCSN